MEGTHSEREYVERVRQCQAFIGAGDIYQANLAQRFSVAFNPVEDDSLHTVGHNLYHRLRMVNPSPFFRIIRDRKPRVGLVPRPNDSSRSPATG